MLRGGVFSLTQCISLPVQAPLIMSTGSTNINRVWWCQFRHAGWLLTLSATNRTSITTCVKPFWLLQMHTVSHSGIFISARQCERVPLTSVNECSSLKDICITNLLCYYLPHSYNIGQIRFVSVPACVRLPVCAHCRGGISSSIVAKSGTEVTTPRVCRGVQHRITSSPILSPKPQFWGRE